MKRKIVLLLCISLMAISLLASCSKEEKVTASSSVAQIEENNQEAEKVSPSEISDAFNQSMADATANFWDI